MVTISQIVLKNIVSNWEIGCEICRRQDRCYFKRDGDAIAYFNLLGWRYTFPYVLCPDCMKDFEAQAHDS